MADKYSNLGKAFVDMIRSRDRVLFALRDRLAPDLFMRIPTPEAYTETAEAVATYLRQEKAQQLNLDARLELLHLTVDQLKAKTARKRKTRKHGGQAAQRVPGAAGGGGGATR